MMMAKLNSTSKVGISIRVNPLLLHLQTRTQLLPNFIPTSKAAALSRKYPLPPLAAAGKKEGRGSSSRGVITVSFPSGQWAGDWTYDYLLTLRDLHLHDLAEDGRKHTQLHLTISLHKHAGVGISADGRIVTSIARKCKNCSSFYCCEIDTPFNVWVLPSSRDDSSNQLPELGGDPSVIFVKPGYDAVLDSFIQETVRLQILVKETCSDACEKADTKLHCKYSIDQDSCTMRYVGLKTENRMEEHREEEEEVC